MVYLRRFSETIPGNLLRIHLPVWHGVGERWQFKTRIVERVTSILLRIETRPDDAEISRRLSEWFVPESLAVASVLDDAAVAAGDFRIDEAGHMRFAIFANPETGERRIGRVVQRLCEIETYKTMSMLGFARVRATGPQMNSLDSRLIELVSDMSSETAQAEATLKALLEISAELETVAAQGAFRFGATGAYEAIVYQRITALREARHKGRQTFSEFMMRRYEPAMRTVKSTEARLATMIERAERAANLLRTRVDVERSAQNQKLLESMDKRSDLQLRLQRTVEGLSVVAISYYAVNLALYIAQPLGVQAGLTKTGLAALITPLVVLVVWLLVQRIRKHVS